MNSTRKELYVGPSDFKKLIEGNYYYVDKTLFIEEIMKRGGEVTLIPRPRRFGKTINLSMLQYFFDCTQPDNEKLFHGTKIWEHKEYKPYRALQGEYPIIFLSFREVNHTSWEAAYEKLTDIIAQEFKRHKVYLEKSLDEDNRRSFDLILNQTGSSVKFEGSIKLLTQFLKNRFSKRVMVFVDEYDTPIHAAYQYGYYDSMVGFIKNLLMGAYKDNSNLERGVITGIMRTAKEGVFSGLNNLVVSTILDDDFADKFGFTHDEVDTLLCDYNLINQRNDFKHWYDGYKIGNYQMYNPWSVVSSVKTGGKFALFWANSSDNKIVKEVIMQANGKTKQELESLVGGGIIRNKIIDPHIIFSQIQQKPEVIWSFLLMAGYLTVKTATLKGKWTCDLMIPNEELVYLYRDLVEQAMSDFLHLHSIEVLLSALVSGNAKIVQQYLQEFVINSMSYFDIKKKKRRELKGLQEPGQQEEVEIKSEPELSYHLFVLGMLVLLKDSYQVKSNRESGFGRYDIMLIPRDRTKNGVVIEFKSIGEYEKQTLDEAADKALDQIHKQNYKQELLDSGVKNIIGYGVAFQRKRVLLKAQILAGELSLSE